MPVRDPSTTSNGVTLLTVLLVLFVLLTFLCLFKWLFTRSRRFWFKKLGDFSSESSLTTTSAQVFAKYQPGFFVGFFGSPTWETSNTITIHKIVHEQQQSFFTPESPQCNHSDFKLSEAILSSCAGHGRLQSMSSFGQALEPSFWSQKLALATPTPPPPVVCEDAKLTSRRRYSLPSMASSDVQRCQTWSTKERGNYQGSGPESIFFSPRMTRDRFDNRVFTQSSSHLLCSGTSEIETKTTIDPSRVLLPNTAVNTGNTTYQCIDEVPLGPILSVPTSGPFPPMDYIKADCQSPLLSSQARNLVRPLVFDAIESALHTDTLNGTTLPLSPVAMFKLRPKNRTLSRTKRSPPLGPSPLRTMILPECSDSDLSPTVVLENDAIRLGSLDQNIVSSIPNPTSVQGHDNDPLLGLIRELVDEVNDWDESLFMDNNFKTMIERSQDIPFEIPSGIDRSFKSNVFGNNGLNLHNPFPISGGGQVITWNRDDSDSDHIGIAQ